MRSTRPLLVAVLTTALAGAASLGAQAAPDQGTDSDRLVVGSVTKSLRDKAIAAVKTGPSKSRDVVRLNPSALDKARIDLTVGGRTVAVERGKQTANRSGSTTWVGTVAGTDDSVILVRDGDRITGSTRIGLQQYRIQPGPDGTHVISAINEQAMPAEHPDVLPDGSKAAPGDGAGSTQVPRRPAAPLANTVVRVQVIGTSQAEAAYGGSLRSMAELAVAETNQGYANSGIPITMELAGYNRLTYTEAGMSTDLGRFRSTTDGYLDQAHTLRNQLSADVNVLLVNDTSYCGIAYLNATAASAFGVVSTQCATGYYSFGHEIGHNQGAEHDPANSSSSGYNHGYQYPAAGWRTIMAYACATASCTRLNNWSNPRVTRNGVPMGTATTNDNARKLSETAATVASFR